MSAIPIYFCKQHISVHPGCWGGDREAAAMPQPCKETAAKGGIESDEMRIKDIFIT